jgi:hypothetical protein
VIVEADVAANASSLLEMLTLSGRALILAMAKAESSVASSIYAAIFKTLCLIVGTLLGQTARARGSGDTFLIG